MARFYQTSEMDFIDYLQEPQETASSSTVSSAFGDINSIPEDREILNNVLSGYEAEINEMTTELQTDPRAMKRLEPRIASLRQRMAQDRQTGVLKAIEDRYNQDVAAQEGLATSLKDDPIQLSMAAQEYRSTIPPLNFDPQTRTFNQITPMAVAKPLLQKDWEDWKTSNATRIEETMLDMLKEQQKLDPTNTLFTESKVMGVTRERATVALAEAVTPDMVRAAEQQRRYYNLSGDPEGRFLNEDGTPNLNTQIGRQIASTVEAVSRTTVDKWRNVVGNRAAEMAIGNRLQNQGAEWWASKLSALWTQSGVGRPSAEQEAALRDLTPQLAGTKTRDGYTIESAYITSTGTPRIKLVKEETSEASAANPLAPRTTERLEREMDLDVATLQGLTSFSPEFVGKIGIAAQNKPGFNRQVQEFRERPRRAFGGTPRQRDTQPRTAPSQPAQGRAAQQQAEQPAERVTSWEDINQ